jgi:uncharacterized protein YeaO (DUF488 family)
MKRVYDKRTDTDGLRILVDRLWPRGLSKPAADLDDWYRDIAPSTELRKWYGHVADQFPEFRRRYLAELDDPARAELVESLRGLTRSHDLMLLTATKEIELSHLVVLAEVLRGAA